MRLISRKFLRAYAAEITEKDLEHLTAHREREDMDLLTLFWAGLS
jgi:hypothetical protein